MAEPLTLSQQPASFEGWTCPLPLRDSPTVVMGHGGGGAMSGELVEHVFLPAFADESLAQLGDSAVLPLLGGRVAFSTDSFVVRPLFFPGGSIGDLAVNGRRSSSPSRSSSRRAPTSPASEPSHSDSVPRPPAPASGSSPATRRSSRPVTATAST